MLRLILAAVLRSRLELGGNHRFVRLKSEFMLKQFWDGINAARINTALDRGLDALRAGQIDAADRYLDKAHKLQANTLLPRMMHIETILTWGMISVEARKLGHTVLADNCLKMNKILQARFDAGEYYSDPGP